jgi:single-strand DNA-binding protein
MAGYNRVIMIGNLTRDPEYKQLASGQAVCRLGLASNRQFKNRQTGDMIQEVCYIDVDVWGAQAESCRQYLQKGRPVLIEGRLKLDQWEDQNGQQRSKHSIVADRVIFLTTGTEKFEGATKSDEAEQVVEPSNEMERELMEQIQRLKKREGSAKAAKTKSAVVTSDSNIDMESQSGEIDFKDQQPFQDDLPF